MRKLLKSAAHFIAAAVAASPWGASLVRKSALVPVGFKTRFFARAMSMIAGKADLADDLIETNFGVSNDLRVMIPRGKYELLYGRPNDHIGERATLDLVSLLSARSKFFIDVGANEGIFTFAVASALGASRAADIHLFEADCVLFDRLVQNLRRNRLAAHANNVAVGQTSGTTTFYRNLTDDSSGSLNTFFTARHCTLPVEVAVTSLQDYLRNHDLVHACVKVDVEGSGAEVWEGAHGALDRIDFLVMEMIENDWKAELPARIIAETGRTAYYIRDYELRQWTHGSYNCLDPCYNWLFCAVSPADLSSTLDSTRFKVCGE